MKRGEAETGDLMTKMKGVGIISRNHISNMCMYIYIYKYRFVYNINTCTNKTEQKKKYIYIHMSYNIWKSYVYINQCVSIIYIHRGIGEV